MALFDLPREEMDCLPVAVLDSGWRTADPGVATAITMTQPDRIRLNRVPAETIVGGFIPRIITKPERTATTVEERLYEHWNEAIVLGAKSLLKEIPDKKWSDMKMSIWYGKQFNFQIQRAKDRANMSYFKKSTTARNVAWL